MTTIRSARSILRNSPALVVARDIERTRKFVQDNATLFHEVQHLLREREFLLAIVAHRQTAKARPPIGYPEIRAAVEDLVSEGPCSDEGTDSAGGGSRAGPPGDDDEGTEEDAAEDH